MGKKWKEVNELRKNKDNRKWIWKTGMASMAKVTGVVLTAWTLLQALFSEWPPAFLLKFMPAWVVNWLILAVLFVALIVEIIRAAFSMLQFTSVKEEVLEKDGCSIEISMADSYLTNAFSKYPKSTMLIGLNKCCWFREAEPNSLVADMWKKLEEYGIDKVDVQKQIDEVLERLEEKNPNIVDRDRPWVKIRRTYVEGKDPEEERGTDYVIRKNYEIGVVFGVDLKGVKKGKLTVVPLKKRHAAALASAKKRKNYLMQEKLYKKGRFPEAPEGECPESYWHHMKMHKVKKQDEDFFKKLFFITNAEVVQGMDTTEPIKVAPDEHNSVVENLENIWTYFETDEFFNQEPPETTLYSPLLVPLIGGGVANEGYKDLEIFSTLVDLYYNHLRAALRAGKTPAVRKLIINIRNNTAIDTAESLNGRQIDIKTAKWYLAYRNSVNKPTDNIDDIRYRLEMQEEVENAIERNARGEI